MKLNCGGLPALEKATSKLWEATSKKQGHQKEFVVVFVWSKFGLLLSLLATWTMDHKQILLYYYVYMYVRGGGGAIITSKF